MKHLLLLLLAMTATLPTMAQDEIEMTTAEAAALMSQYNVSIRKSYGGAHDPSIVYDHTRNRYYIFGSHQSWAWSADMQNWNHISSKWGPTNNIYSDFNTNMIKTVTIGGQQKTFGNFNAQTWACAYGNWNIAGNLWAPSVIFNKKTGMWSQYLSVNGPNYNSVIILLTSTNIEGPYYYQGPVVYSGFFNTGVADLSWKNTDVPLALGSGVTELPARYNITQGQWGFQWQNCIDPCVYYDTNDNLYMVYGSWFGGLWVLELDENTGLRDYNVQYGSDYASAVARYGNGENVTHDPYYGIKLHGGHWVSGEGPFVERIGNYYYLFVTNGGLEADGGYQMRVFRSENPTGPFVDSRGVSAIYEYSARNYGVNPDTRGEKIIGQYNNWGFMTVGEVAQGHNSTIAAPDGRTYIIYHTRFGPGGAGFQDRVHQLFLTEDDWLVASPFEYNGEQITDDDIFSTQSFDAVDVVGTYDIIIHKYSIDNANYEMVTPVKITLEENGHVSGAYSGSWSLVPGTSYFHITIGGVAYKGVIYEEIMDGKAIHTVSFSAMAPSGVNVWGYKYHPKYALAMQLNQQTLPIRDRQNISNSMDLMGMKSEVDNINLEWTSDQPDIISSYGRYNPTGLTEDTPVHLTLRISCGRYFWTQEFTVNARAETIPESDYYSGMCAYYNFDESPATNAFNTDEHASLSRYGSGVKPTFMEATVRNGRMVHTNKGTKGNESLVRIKNPLYQQTIGDGITVAFWVKMNEQDLENPLVSFMSTPTKHFYLTGNTHVAFTDGTNEFSINSPDVIKPGFFKANEWTFVTLTLSRDLGIRLYLNGTRRQLSKFSGKMNGEDVAAQSDYDYNLVADFLQNSQYICFGYGSPYGSPDAYYDDLFVYDRVLSTTEASALRTMANRVYDFNQLATGIDEIASNKSKQQSDDAVYDLQGRRVGTSLDAVGRGIYIFRGKKILVK